MQKRIIQSTPTTPPPTLGDTYFTVTKEEFARELKTTIANLNQILLKPDRYGFPKPGPANVRREGLKNYYSRDYVDLVKGIIETRRKRRNVKDWSAAMAGAKSAKLQVQVTLFDPIICDVLMKKFGSQEAIGSYMKDHLEGLIKPALSKLAEFRRKKALEEEALIKSL
jgi:hypothetical protein